MALVNTVISKSLFDFLISIQDPKTITDADKDRIKAYADGLTDWMVETIKSADVIVPIGVPVATTGSPSAQTGATTGVGKADIS